MVQILMASHKLLFHPAPMASGEVPCDQLMEEEKTQAWFAVGSAQYTGTTHKVTAAILLTLLGTS